MKTTISSIFIVALVALFGCAPANATNDYFDKLIKLSEQGVADAQFNLGLMYEKGRGVPEDDTEAVKWFCKAAEQGNPPAQCLLGVMYADSRGVPEDAAEAVKWYRKAEEQGHADAQTLLGAMCAEGLGVPEDYAIAYAWFNVAAPRRGSSFQRGKSEPIR